MRFVASLSRSSLLRFMPAAFKTGDSSPPTSSWMPAAAPGGSPVLGAPAVALTTSVSAEKAAMNGGAGAGAGGEKPLNFAACGESTLQLAQLDGLSIAFHSLLYKVSGRKGSTVILNRLSGFCSAGKLTALLGPSGAGKVRMERGWILEERGAEASAPRWRVSEGGWVGVWARGVGARGLCRSLLFLQQQTRSRRRTPSFRRALRRAAAFCHPPRHPVAIPEGWGVGLA